MFGPNINLVSCLFARHDVCAEGDADPADALAAMLYLQPFCCLTNWPTQQPRARNGVQMRVSTQQMDTS